MLYLCSALSAPGCLGCMAGTVRQADQLHEALDWRLLALLCAMVKPSQGKAAARFSGYGRRLSSTSSGLALPLPCCAPDLPTLMLSFHVPRQPALTPFHKIIQWLDGDTHATSTPDPGQMSHTQYRLSVEARSKRTILRSTHPTDALFSMTKLPKEVICHRDAVAPFPASSGFA